jgi:hypothetical protein
VGLKDKRLWVEELALARRDLPMFQGNKFLNQGRNICLRFTIINIDYVLVFKYHVLFSSVFKN